MKPSKNRIYCIGCKRHKMLFEDKKKADNFIRFNRDTILEESGKAPVRSYYCVFCSSWHVTNNSSLEHGEEKDKRDIETISTNGKISSLNMVIRQKFMEIKNAIYLSDDNIDVFKEFENCKSLLNELTSINLCAIKLKTLHQNNIMTDIFSSLYKIKLMELPELKRYIETLSPNSEKVILLKRYAMRRIIDLSLLEAISLKESGLLNKAYEIKEELLSMLTEVEGTGRKKFISKCKNIIDEVSYKLSFQSNNEKSNLSLEKYKDKLLLLINNLETINEEFENLNFSVCNELVKKGIYELSAMPKDQNTKLVMQHYMNWKKMLDRI